MDVEVTFLTQRGTAVMRRTRRIDSRRLRLGRGTHNEIQLPDIRVDLAAAALYPRDDILTIQAMGPSLLRVNGKSERQSPVRVGDELRIGPYRIQLTEPPQGCDAALLIELAQPLGDSLQRLTSQIRRASEGVTISKRVASWTGVLVIALVFFVGPMIAYFSQPRPPVANASGAGALAQIARLWEPGELSNAHRFFASDCAVCHQAAFARVPDNGCLDCHRGVGRHTQDTVEAGHLQDATAAMRCTECHEEHRGSHAMVVSEAGLCLQCHRSLTKTAAGTQLRDVSGFPAGHPQFRATLVADPARSRFDRVELGGTPSPGDRPGIKFSHAAHLVPGGFPALGYKQMICADCHKAEPAGEGFATITYQQNCQRCHGLDFERQDLPWPNARVPHGDDIGIAAAVWNFYAGKALQGGIGEPPADAVVQRVPGAPGPGDAQQPRGEPSADRISSWVEAKTAAVLRTIIFDEKRGCAYCHFGVGPDGAFDLSALSAKAVEPGRPPAHIVAPVVLRSRFLPFAHFNHAKHAAMDCNQCHDAQHAESSSTVLIPGIENCAACHGAEKATTRAQSTCITCHRFHNSGFGPIGALGTASQ